MLHVRQGTTVGSLTLFPVWQDRTSTGTRRYDTSAEALQAGEAEGGPSVPQLVATNTGTAPVLVLDGQLFEGDGSTGWRPGPRWCLQGPGRCSMSRASKSTAGEGNRLR